MCIYVSECVCICEWETETDEDRNGGGGGFGQKYEKIGINRNKFGSL